MSISQLCYIDTATSGYIYKNGGTTVFAGGDGVVLGSIAPALPLARAYLSFNTSVLPDNISILSATLNIYYYAKLPGGPTLPNAWLHQLLLGANVIGAALDASDWGSPGFLNNGSFTPDNNLIQVPIIAARLLNISKTGKTDFEFRDISLAAGSGSWQIAIHTTGARQPVLEVVYNLPMLYNCNVRNCFLKNA